MAIQKILVIDDSRMIRMRIKDMLPAAHVEVFEARDGKEGLELIHSQQPNLIILDFLLPKMSGWQVYQEIQKSPQLQAIPLIIMSGRKEEVTERVPEPFGNFAFVEKPFEQEQLLKAIKEATSKANARQAMANLEQPTPAVPASDANAAARIAKLEDKVEKMQAQINLLNKQLAQIVGFIKKKLK